MVVSQSWLGRLTAAFALGVATLALFAMAAILLPGKSDANPAMARMTGKTCAACHVPAQEPRLNPYGQAFKNCGYQECGGGAPRPAPMPQFGGGGGGGHAMCNQFACNSHNTCRFRIRFANGNSREVSMRRGEKYTVRDVHANDRWCFIEPNGTCEMKHMNLRPC